MPRGQKSSYSDKQKRMAEHIEEGYEKRGTSKGEAERRAWATVNKETHGGNPVACAASGVHSLQSHRRNPNAGCRPVLRGAYHLERRRPTAAR